MQTPTTRRKFVTDMAKLATAAYVLPSFLQSCGGATKKIQQTAKIIAPTGWVQAPLGYEYKALEPYIDAATMEIHHTKHAAAYTKNMSDAMQTEGVVASASSVEDILGKIAGYSAKMRNNAGGHYNHELFWKLLRPATTDNKPGGQLMLAIEQKFGSFDAFKNQFSDAAKNRFGSGWAWLVVDANKQLSVGSTANQDNPLMSVSDLRGVPVLALDVWEHAYYLKYQNKRADYITNWWNVVNWKVAEERFGILA
jgi:superoxide dismutase, Fe-Mn family